MAMLFALAELCWLWLRHTIWAAGEVLLKRTAAGDLHLSSGLMQLLLLPECVVQHDTCLLSLTWVCLL